MKFSRQSNVATQLIVLAAMAFAVLPSPVAAQALALKRELPGESSGPCPAPVPIGSAVLDAEQQAQVSQLLTAANQAALLGDQTGARDLYRRVALLDPSNADVTYRLARTYEELDARGAAAAQYCRYLDLAPDAEDAAAVRDRIQQLAPRQDAVPAAAAQQFRAGLDSFDQRQWVAAERAFSLAMGQAPGWVELFYNRALAREAQGAYRGAVDDYRSYLRLSPNAGDGAVVRQHTEALAQAVPSTTPGAVFFRGALVPGLGQFSTGRPALGVLVLGGAAAAVAAGIREEERTETVFCFPFGEPVPCGEQTVLERPGLGAGIALAAGIGLLGALEAFAYARRQEVSRPRAPSAAPTLVRVMPRISPGSGRIGLELRFPLSRR